MSAALQVDALRIALEQATERNEVLSKQLAAAEHELRLMCSEQLKLYRRFHVQSKSDLCPHCHHKHLSKAHAQRCPDCACREVRA